MREGLKQSVLTLIAGLWLAAGQGVSAQLPPPVVTFDSAWTIIRNTHFDTTFNGLDWNRLGAELRPRAVAAKNNDELRTVLLDMLNRLKQSHFTIIPKEAVGSAQEAGGAGDLGLYVRWVENALTVTAVEAGSPAAQAGVKPGWILTRVGDQRADSMLARARRDPNHRQIGVTVPRIAQGRLAGTEGSAVELELLDGRNQRVVIKPTRRKDPGAAVTFGNLPTFYTRFVEKRVTHEGATIGVLAFNVWMAPLMARIDTAMDRQRDTHGIVLDLRGNPGGLAAMAMGVAGHFVDSAKALGIMSSRKDKLVFRINPRRLNTAGERVLPFSGPLAILTDELSGSTSEVFAGGLQSLGRVRVFGAVSMGAVLPAAMDRLPSGDVLYHAIADFVTSDGTVLEGRGVIPDEPVEVKRADLLAGRDPVLEAALRWIAAETRAQRRTTTGEMSQ